MFKEFKEFAFKGNVIDLAVGVIIGGAFGKIVTSLVNDLLMPALGILLGGVDFTQLKYVITPAIGEIPESAIMYGTFIQSIVDFLIIAFSIFVFIRLFNRKKKEEPAPEPEPAKPSQEVLLLEEIRDLLKKNN
ncbi:MAG TPA: large-conductance mechanosensitive channel protein MscL [Eubacteriaceae bacterium]|nr:large-conductance mechanosensitive channel protein MscL [Eubacteriaceae bacterium]